RLNRLRASREHANHRRRYSDLIAAAKGRCIARLAMVLLWLVRLAAPAHPSSDFLERVRHVANLDPLLVDTVHRHNGSHGEHPVIPLTPFMKGADLGLASGREMEHFAALLLAKLLLDQVLDFVP